MDGRQSFRIGFWLGAISLHHGGLAPYTRRILNELLTHHEPGWHFAILCHEAAQQPDAVHALVDAHKERATLHTIPSEVESGSLWQQQVERASAAGGQPYCEELAATEWHHLSGWINNLQLDLIHFPNSTPPFPSGHVPYLVPPLATMPIPFVVTVHDLQELRFPEYFSAAQRAVRAMHHWKVVDQARRIIVSYDHIKADLLRFFHVSAERIHVCPIPYRSITLQTPTKETAASYKEKYQSWNPFLLYPAQTWPHKNHRQLLRALHTLRERRMPTLKLICTGGHGEAHHSLLIETERLNLGDAVLFAGILPEDELQWLYQHTALVVIPTEYEAGSFPLLEAMLQSVPVICSNVTSLPETIGDERFVFTPNSTEQLANLIERMMTDDKFRQANISNSTHQAAKLRQVNAAPRFYNAYRKAVAN